VGALGRCATASSRSEIGCKGTERLGWGKWLCLVLWRLIQAGVRTLRTGYPRSVRRVRRILHCEVTREAVSVWGRYVTASERGYVALT
jgi:hypothetical protein